MKDRIKRILASVLETVPENISDDASQKTLENWDSLHHLMLVMALEEEFGVSFSDSDIFELLSIELIEISLREKGCS